MDIAIAIIAFLAIALNLASLANMPSARRDDTLVHKSSRRERKAFERANDDRVRG